MGNNTSINLLVGRLLLQLGALPIGYQYLIHVVHIVYAITQAACCTEQNHTMQLHVTVGGILKVRLQEFTG